MKSKARVFCLLFLFATLLGGNVALFAAVAFAYLNRAPFWISWGFAVGSGVLAYLNLAFLRKGKLPDLIGLLAYLVYAGFAALFTYTMPAWGVVLATELVLTAAILFLFFLSIRPRYDRTFREEKISSLRELSASVEISATETDDPDLKEKLEKLAGDLRYADPISPPSAEKTERALYAAIHALPVAIQMGKAEEKIAECERLLKARALICMNDKPHE